MLSRFRHIAAAAAATVSLVATAAPAAHAFTPAPVPTSAVPCAIDHCVWVKLRLDGVGSGNVTMVAQRYLLDTSTARDIGMDCVRIGGTSASECSALVRWSRDYDKTWVIWTATPTPGSVACDLVDDSTNATRLGACGRANETRTGAFLLSIGDPPLVDVGGNALLSLRGHFEKAARTLVVTKSGAGRITSDAGIDCGATCTASVLDGTRVTLTARPDAGARFRQWTGACYGQGATCTLTLDRDMKTDAVFELAGQGYAATQPPASTDGSTRPHTGGSGTAPSGSSGASGRGNAPGASSRAPGNGTGPGGSSVNHGSLALRARLLSLRTALGRTRRRRVSLALTTNKRASVDLTLSRGRIVIAHRSADVPDGGGALSLAVPAKVRRGRARLVVRVRSGDGGGRTFTRTVRLG
jgi:hypothetical protein